MSCGEGGKRGRGLPRPLCGELLPPRPQDESPQAEPELGDEEQNERRHPNPAGGSQRGEEPEVEQLVHHGVQELAEHRYLARPPGHPPVEDVRGQSPQEQ